MPLSRSQAQHSCYRMSLGSGKRDQNNGHFRQWTILHLDKGILLKGMRLSEFIKVYTSDLVFHSVQSISQSLNYKKSL